MRFPMLVATWALGLAGPALAANYQGLWYAKPAESESGWGVNLAQQGDALFATWFTYDASGRNWWLVFIGSQTAPGAFGGTLYTTRGPAFSAVPFNPASVAVTAAGTASFAFDDTGDGTFSYTVAGVTQSKAITRQVYGAVPSCAHGIQPDLSRATNYQDLWYASPAESEAGWGINFAHQGETLFATWFTYDATGAPQWLVGVLPRTGAASFAGTLLRTTGPAFSAVPFAPTAVTRTPAGTLSVAFAHGNAGTLQYTLDGVTQSKAITRQVFRPPGTTCQYAEGVWTGTADNGQRAVAIVLEDARSFVYWAPPGGGGGRFVEGRAAMDGGRMTVAQALAVPVAAASETTGRVEEGSLSATYEPGGAFQASHESGGLVRRVVNASFQAGSRTAPAVAAMAGRYTGISGHADGRLNASVTIDAQGNLEGTNAACTFRGTLQPRASVAVFDIAIQAVSGSCIFPGSLPNGIAHYDEAVAELRIFGVFPDRSDAFYVIATRR